MRQRPNNIIAHSKEALAVGVSAALFATLGAVAAKASTTSEKVTKKSGVPYLVSGKLRPEHSQDLPIIRPFKAGEGMSFKQFDFTRHLLNRVNTGPYVENIIDNGGMRLMPGAIIYKAPMKSAVDHVIDSKHVEFWSFPRLMEVNGELWAATRNIINKDGQIDEALDGDWATDPRFSRWVNIPQAKRVPEFEHVMPWASNPNNPHLRTVTGPPVYGVMLNSQSNILINQPHPEELSDPRYLAIYQSFLMQDVKRAGWMKKGWMISANGIVFFPTPRPVQFVKADYNTPNTQEHGY